MPENARKLDTGISSSTEQTPYTKPHATGHVHGESSSVSKQGVRPCWLQTGGYPADTLLYSNTTGLYAKVLPGTR